MSTRTRPPRPPIVTAPCDNCPFRASFKGDADYLRPRRRAEIVHALQDGGSFACHKTTVPDDDGEGSEMLTTSRSRECAGASLVMLRSGQDTNAVKFAERLSGLDVEAFIAMNADVELWTFHECDEEGLEDVETCNTVGPTCLAPAGYAVGGGIQRGEVAADLECPQCGEAVCSECVDEEGLCGTCSEVEW